jgi:sterol desaturase/sphingolipid hydroxylase (fatty acid hydroxylase superfamily)
MGDTDWGKRDSRGEWQPEPELLPKPSPIFRLPWKPWDVAKYLFAPQGFLWPWNLFYALLAVVAWLWFTPGFDRTVRFEAGWIAELYLRNAVILILIAGGLHLRLYVTRGQGTKFKFTNKWVPAKDPKFLFGHQTWDNIFWNLASGCVVWTAYESVTLWAYAHHLIPYVNWRAHPIYCVLLMVGVVYLRLFHFYFVHRLIHWGPLYRISHYVHHNNINIGPWSGMSMHPLEHVVYLSGVFLHWIIPSHPLHAIFHLMHAGASPAPGHSGFYKFTGKGERGVIIDNYFHYLHHRFFTVNYGVEALPLDKWFGSFDDGSPEVHAALMAKRSKAKKTGA